ncbi:hypothetical protein [Streptomyces sp. NPDC058451]|uniref:hypothetical protein n=1 Tax=Streptomyces sp. NPDC058451 TaxID=3346506 RepID=UPI003655E73C
MADPTRYTTPPVELPLDPWLLDGTPANGCDVCMALARQRKAALGKGDSRKAFEAAAEIRKHPHGRRK